MAGDRRVTAQKTRNAKKTAKGSRTSAKASASAKAAGVRNYAAKSARRRSVTR